MRRLVLSVVLMATGSLTFAAQAGAAASTVTTNVRTPIDSLVFASCANGGAGEDVAVSGTLHEVFHTTVDNAGGFHVRQESNPQGLSGVGQVTGTQYQVTGGNVLELNMKAAFEETLVNNFRVIGQGPDNNFVFHQTSHVTVNANGTVTAEHLSFQFECK
jgi:hypothetical protein